MVCLMVQLDRDWLVTDVHNQDVLFGSEEISEMVNTIVGQHPDRCWWKPPFDASTTPAPFPCKSARLSGVLS